MLPCLDGIPCVSEVGEAVAHLPWRSTWTIRLAETARVRAAIAGEDLALEVEVVDREIHRGTLAWQGSCVEVFPTPAEAEQWHPTQGNPHIRQVLLVPATATAPACAFSQVGAREHPAPSIRLHTVPLPHGYRLHVLIPLALLGLAADMETFRWQLVITSFPVPGGAEARAPLFNLGFGASGNNIFYGVARLCRKPQ